MPPVGNVNLSLLFYGNNLNENLFSCLSPATIGQVFLNLNPAKGLTFIKNCQEHFNFNTVARSKASARYEGKV